VDLSALQESLNQQQEGRGLLRRSEEKWIARCKANTDAYLDWRERITDMTASRRFIVSESGAVRTGILEQAQRCFDKEHPPCYVDEESDILLCWCNAAFWPPEACGIDSFKSFGIHSIMRKVNAMKKKAAKKRNAQDATLRNVRAAERRHEDVLKCIEDLSAEVTESIGSLSRRIDDLIGGLTTIKTGPPVEIE